MGVEDGAASGAPVVYLLWWSVGATAHPFPRAAHQEMYVGSTDSLRRRLGNHQRGRGSSPVAGRWSDSGPPAAFWLPCADRDQGYLLERAIVECAISEHDWWIDSLLGQRRNRVPRLLLNHHRPATSSENAAAALNERSWEMLQQASRLLSEFVR